MDRLEQEFADFKEQTARRLDRVEEQIASLAAEVRSLAEQVRALASAVRLLSQRLDLISGYVDNLRGEAQERKVAFKVNSVISQPRGLRRTRVVLSIGEAPPRELLDPIEDARDEDRITEEQFRRILDTDLVFFARRRRDDSAERELVCCAVEISTTIREDDISRARQSAEALRAAVGNGHARNRCRCRYHREGPAPSRLPKCQLHADSGLRAADPLRRPNDR